MQVTNTNELLEAYSKGKRDFSFSELRGIDLSWVDLKEVNLRDANLREANLERIDLIGANLDKANLKEANLRSANLSQANLMIADLIGADLSQANLEGADLRNADLRKANLTKANLKGTNLGDVNLKDANLTETKLDYQIESGLLKKIAEVALKEDNLDMNYWHTCDTCHCIAGWAVTLAENGRKLEEEYGTANAGLLLLGAEAHSHFFDDDYDARKYLESILEK